MIIIKKRKWRTQTNPKLIVLLPNLNLRNLSNSKLSQAKPLSALRIAYQARPRSLLSLSQRVSLNRVTLILTLKTKLQQRLKIPNGKLTFGGFGNSGNESPSFASFNWFLFLIWELGFSLFEVFSPPSFSLSHWFLLSLYLSSTQIGFWFGTQQFKWRKFPEVFLCSDSSLFCFMLQSGNGNFTCALLALILSQCPFGHSLKFQLTC